MYTTFDLLLENIGKHVMLTKEEAADLCALFTVRQLKRKEFLLKAGEICLHECFINTGCLRTYYEAPTGIEHNYYFATEGWWISDIHSRTFKVPSFCNIVTIEESEVLQVLQSDLEAYLQKVPKLEHFFRVLYQHSIAGHQLKLLQMQHMTAEQRYAYFRQKYPQFDKRIPQKHIATYLGLTAEFFNTVRTKVLRNT